MVDLGVLEALGCESAQVRAMSADGAVIVGEAYPGEPWIWREGAGARTIRDVLIEAGVDLLGWQIDVTALSADGRVIIGSGSDPAQKRGAWLAGLP